MQGFSLVLRFGKAGFAAALLLGPLAAGACASEEAVPAGFKKGTGGSGAFGTDGGGTGGTGTGGGGFGGTGATGGTGTGGMSASGGTSGTGGTGGTGGATPACEPAEPTIDPTVFPECECAGARCVPKSAVTDPQQQEQLAECPDGTSYCVPDFFVATAGKFIAKSCRSLNNAEGRCLSVCIPQIDAQKERLPQDVCATGELCAPCYDPTTLASTGACNVACDPGPAEPPVGFDKCCGGIGSCVPDTLVTPEQQAQLGKDTCTGTNYLCAPDKLVDPTFKPLACRSIGDTEGRCMAACLPAVASQKDRLPQAVCDTGELCAPCYDPISGELTGACNQNDDAPVEDPKLFAKCCHDIGACVPESAVPTTQRSQLAKDSCGTGELCAPTALTDSTFKPPTCRATFGTLQVEGRCLPDCLASIQSQKDRLARSTCEEFHLCAPCYDPVTGQPTGACEQNADKPAEAPKLFPKCCNNNGACVPTSLIPTAQQSSLGTDTCTGTGVLCVPSELSSSTYIPPTCRSLGDAEGRCLPACLPEIQAQASRLPQSTCTTAQKCAPCYDPTDGVQTSACTLNGDAPKEPKYTFPKCCAYQNTTRGTCVPDSALTPAQASSLPTDTCPTTTTPTPWSCVPDLKVADPTAKFAPCTVPVSIPCLFGGCPGACVPDCVPDASQKGLLLQATCQAGELCAPCVNPLTGQPSGACD